MNTKTMDFFMHQERARRRSGLLVGCYIAAVALIVLGVYLAVGTLLTIQAGGNALTLLEETPQVFLVVAAVTLLVIGGGTAFRIATLSGDGAKVASMLGGVEVRSDTADLNERRLLNVVQEMAIASGTPAPRVFVIRNQKGINAFAAGTRLQDAVVAVTDGALEQLNRDELQGVIAHEFSHIFNGDMRLNVRLMGVLFGIVMISVLGRIALRTAFYMPAGGQRRSGRNNRDGGAVAAMAIGGILLIIVGWIGILFAKIIKAGISRQREFLADASAVQFTRNPDGIGGALKKLAGYSRGGMISVPQAEEISHFFFANGLRKLGGGLLATHPPLAERIRRIDQSFAAQIDVAAQSRDASDESALGFAAGGADEQPMDAQTFVGLIGRPCAEHVAYARSLIEGLPEAVRSAVQTAIGARATTYALLMQTSSEKVRQAQLACLREREQPGIVDATQALLPHIRTAQARARLPLIDLCLAALVQMPSDEYAVFRRAVAELIDADGEVSLAEYTLRLVLFRHLDRRFNPAAQRSVRKPSPNSILPACRDILSVLADWGCADRAKAEAAFRHGAEQLEGGATLTMRAGAECTLSLLDDALAKLDGAPPTLRKRIVLAVARCVASDGRINVEEGETLRAIAETLACPVPPLLPEQPIARLSPETGR